MDTNKNGAEPLEAYESSLLTISGNSTSRAYWYKKLGFQHLKQRHFICTFRSLLPDGGLVPFVDVIIVKIYAIGYKGEFVEGQAQDVWNEEEERGKQANWEVSAKSAIRS